MRNQAEERLGLGYPHSPWWGEHRSRYQFAAGYVHEAAVLDVACGSGYGGRILRLSGARFVVGADVSEEALRAAGTQRVPGLHLVQANVGRLPLPDDCVDVVTSFETLEHVDDPGAMLAELRRVLRPGGTLVLSTPNALVTRPVNGVPANPYHVREFTPLELRAMLDQHFADVRQLGQLPHPRFRVTPYWQLDEHLPEGVANRARVVIWKVGARLPHRLREPLWQTFARRPFHPGEHDFVFTENGLVSGHVQVAVCR